MADSDSDSDSDSESDSDSDSESGSDSDSESGSGSDSDSESSSGSDSDSESGSGSDSESGSGSESETPTPLRFSLADARREIDRAHRKIKGLKRRLEGARDEAVTCKRLVGWGFHPQSPRLGAGRPQAPSLLRNS